MAVAPSRFAARVSSRSRQQSAAPSDRLQVFENRTLLRRRRLAPRIVAGTRVTAPAVAAIVGPWPVLLRHHLEARRRMVWRAADRFALLDVDSYRNGVVFAVAHPERLGPRFRKQDGLE